MGETPSCYLDTPQAAALLGLSPRTLESYRVTGGGPPFLTYCNRIHYLRSDLDAWALEGRRRSTSDDGGAAGTGGGRAEGGESFVVTRRGRGAFCRPTAPERRRAQDCLPTNGSALPASSPLSVRELAAMLQVSRRTLDRYRAKGIGPAFEKVNGRVLYPRACVEAWLASSRRGSGSDAARDLDRDDERDGDGSGRGGGKGAR